MLFLCFLLLLLLAPKLSEEDLAVEKLSFPRKGSEQDVIRDDSWRAAACAISVEDIERRVERAAKTRVDPTTSG